MHQKRTKILYSVAAIALILFIFAVLWELRIRDGATQLLKDSDKAFLEVKERLAKTHKPNSIQVAAATANAQVLREDNSLRLSFQNIAKDPYLGGVRFVQYYKDGYGVSYITDPYTNKIIEFVVPAGSDFPFATSSVLTNTQLKEKTQAYLSAHVENFSKVLNTLTYSTAAKPGDDTVMFQWEDKAKTLRDGTHPRIQLVLSKRGDVIHFIDTYQYDQAV